MKIFRNEKLIDRNAKIGQYTNVAGLILLAGTMYLFLTSINVESTVNDTFLLFGLVIVALILTQVSIYFGGRFGRRPRPDEQLDAALKGIPGEYTLHHYTTPVAHLLTGPAGVWILIPYQQKGKIVFQKNHWKNSGGGFLQNYMRIFGQEGLGRPDLESESQIARLEKFFKKNLGEAVPAIHTALVFLDPNIEIESEDSPVPAMQVKKLKEHLRKAAKETPFPQTELDRMKAALAKE